MKISLTVVGVDTAKRVFQLHWVERDTCENMHIRRTRAEFLKHFPHRAPCRIMIETFGGSQHWMRQQRVLGHEVTLLSTKMVRPFVGGNKSDEHDARAIWTTMQQPVVRTVAIKIEEQQAVLTLHRVRQQVVKFGTAQSTGLRGLLTEFGEVLPQGRAGLRTGIVTALERLSERLPWMVIQTLREQWARVIRLDKKVGDIEWWLKLWHRNNVASRRIAEIPVVGILSATAAVAAMGDPDAFRSAREFAAWLGLVPRHRLPPSVTVRPSRNRADCSTDWVNLGGGRNHVIAKVRTLVMHRIRLNIPSPWTMMAKHSPRSTTFGLDTGATLTPTLSRLGRTVSPGSGNRSAKPWNRPARAGHQGARPRGFRSGRSFTAAVRPNQHGLAERSPARGELDKEAQRWCGAALGMEARSLPKRLRNSS